jgi:hypothetical protein
MLVDKDRTAAASASTCFVFVDAMGELCFLLNLLDVFLILQSILC